MTPRRSPSRVSGRGLGGGVDGPGGASTGPVSGRVLGRFRPGFPCLDTLGITRRLDFEAEQPSTP